MLRVVSMWDLCMSVGGGSSIPHSHAACIPAGGVVTGHNDAAAGPCRKNACCPVLQQHQGPWLQSIKANMLSLHYLASGCTSLGQHVCSVLV
jgi:hypothetical protein